MRHPFGWTKLWCPLRFGGGPSAPDAESLFARFPVIGASSQTLARLGRIGGLRADMAGRAEAWEGLPRAVQEWDDEAIVVLLKVC